MYQNLIPGEAWKTSVHWCEYPRVTESLIDEDLSAHMDGLLAVVSLGSAARNAVKIKVRQPLAELKVHSDNEDIGVAVYRFRDQILEELNIKDVQLVNSTLLRFEAKPNMKTLGPKFGSKLKDVCAAIASASTEDLVAKVQVGQPFDLNGFTLDPVDVVVTLKAPDDWAGVADRGTQVLIDARITPDLKREGMARDVVRQIQQLRKDANLDMEDRIELYLHTESAELERAIELYHAYITGETLTQKWWPTTPLGDDAAKANVKIEGQALTIQLRKVPT
jgi:isoleucyl-tRNA synthetase